MLFAEEGANTLSFSTLFACEEEQGCYECVHSRTSMGMLVLLFGLWSRHVILMRAFAFVQCAGTFEKSSRCLLCTRTHTFSISSCVCGANNHGHKSSITRATKVCIHTHAHQRVRVKHNMILTFTAREFPVHTHTHARTRTLLKRSIFSSSP